jgi:hypothetical protein
VNVIYVGSLTASQSSFGQLKCKLVTANGSCLSTLCTSTGVLAQEYKHRRSVTAQCDYVYEPFFSDPVHVTSSCSVCAQCKAVS